MSMPTTAPTPPAAGGRALERPRYYPRQMITSDDLTQGLEYLRQRQRRHNRALHGWGVVYGAGVQPVRDPVDGAIRKVQVQPGLVLSPQGDEIEITAAATVDINLAMTPGAASGTGDPWYSDVVIDRRGSDQVYLAIRCDEAQVRPVRVAPAACDCGGAVPCEYTRIRDSYQLELLDDLPSSHAGDATANQAIQQALKVLADTTADPNQKLAALVQALFGAGLPGPPAAIAEPWVVLATLHLDGDVVIAIDPVSTRRLVVSLAPAWWRPVTPLTIEPPPVLSTPTVTGGRASFTIVVTGKGLLSVDARSVHFQGDESKIRVDSVTPDPTNPDGKLTIAASYPDGPPPSPGRLILIRPDGATAMSSGPLTFPPAPAAPAPGGTGGP